MLRLSFEMLKSSSKRPKSAQKEQTMLKTHDRISKRSDNLSKCSNCLQKRPKSTQKEQRMFKTHDRTPQCSREHSIPSFEPFPGQKTFGNRVQISTVIDSQLSWNVKTGSQIRFWIAHYWGKISTLDRCAMQFWVVLGLPEEVLHRFPASDKPVESENLQPSVTFVSGFGREIRFERVPLMIWCSPEKPGLRPGIINPYRPVTPPLCFLEVTNKGGLTGGGGVTGRYVLIAWMLGFMNG